MPDKRTTGRTCFLDILDKKGTFHFHFSDKIHIKKELFEKKEQNDIVWKIAHNCDDLCDHDDHDNHDDHDDHDNHNVQVDHLDHGDRLVHLTYVQPPTSGQITSKFLTQRKQRGNMRTAKENSVEILKWLLICSQDLRGFVRKVR